jgi:hypothetical protein
VQVLDASRSDSCAAGVTVSEARWFISRARRHRNTIAWACHVGSGPTPSINVPTWGSTGSAQDCWSCTQEELMQPGGPGRPPANQFCPEGFDQMRI